MLLLYVNLQTMPFIAMALSVIDLSVDIFNYS